MAGNKVIVNTIVTKHNKVAFLEGEEGSHLDLAWPKRLPVGEAYVSVTWEGPGSQRELTGEKLRQETDAVMTEQGCHTAKTFLQMLNDTI